MTPEAVIFDIGNVLTRWQPEAFYDRVIGEERRRALFALLQTSSTNHVPNAEPYNPNQSLTCELVEWFQDWLHSRRTWMQQRQD